MGVHFSVDSSGILKLDKAESVIEVWEEYEVEIPVETPKVESESKENITIESRETLESEDADDSQVHVMLGCYFTLFPQLVEVRCVCHHLCAIVFLYICFWKHKHFFGCNVLMSRVPGFKL